MAGCAEPHRGRAPNTAVDVNEGMRDEPDMSDPESTRPSSWQCQAVSTIRRSAGCRPMSTIASSSQRTLTSRGCTEEGSDSISLQSDGR